MAFPYSPPSQQDSDHFLFLKIAAALYELQSGGGGGGSGTVTSVGLSLPSIFTVSGSPVTTSGTLTGDLATQSANTVFAGPASGGPATPTFRTLDNADIPAPGNTGEILFTEAGLISASSELTYNTSTKELSVGINGTTAGFLVLHDQAGVSAAITMHSDAGGAIALSASGITGVRNATWPDASGEIVFAANTVEITNKTISGDANTITNIATTALTGTLQAAQFPALTGDVTTSAGSLATTIANNAVTTAKILNNNVTYPKFPSESESTFLGRAAGAGAGDTQALSANQAMAVLATSTTPPFTQIPVQQQKTDTSSTSSLTFAEIPGLDDCSVTTVASTSKVLVRAVLQVSQSATGEVTHFRLTRDGTAIGVGDAAGSRIQTGATNDDTGDTFGMVTVVMEWLDSPGSAGAHSYAVEWRMSSNSYTAYINRSLNDADAAYSGRAVSVLTAIPFP
jgi:hypothetical protein